MANGRRAPSEPGAEMDMRLRKIRNDLRIVFWMVAASLMITMILFIGVFFIGVSA